MTPRIMMRWGLLVGLIVVFQASPVSAQSHSADTNGDYSISLSELLRVIQFFNSGEFHCMEGTEDGY